MRSFAALGVVVIFLSACASPQLACERAARAELEALDARIAETEAAIARGYRIVPEQQGETRLSLCAWPREPVLFCTEPLQQPRSRQRERVDPVTEQRVLEVLREERNRLVMATADRLSACRVP